MKLPAGARVMAHFASANRDDCVFADPDSYCPAARRHRQASRVREGHPFLHRRATRPSRASRRAANAFAPPAKPAPRTEHAGTRDRLLRARVHLSACGVGHVSEGVVIVTGSAGGLGQVYCRELRAAGYTVVGADLAETSGAHLSVVTDVTDRQADGAPRSCSARAVRPHRRPRQQRGLLQRDREAAVRGDRGRRMDGSVRL